MNAIIKPGLTRREFIKGIIAAGFALNIVGFRTKDNEKFDPSWEYGRCIDVIHGPVNYSDIKANSLCMKLLHRQAKEILPKGTYYEIRGRYSSFEPYRRGLAWYYAPGLKPRKQSNIREDGYIFLGGFYA